MQKIEQVSGTVAAPAPSPTPAAAASAASGAETIEEIASLRAIARQGLADARARGDDYSLRAWALAQSRILDQSAIAEERLLAVARARRELLSVEEGREIFGRVLQDSRRLIDAMPAALAAQVNPHDPAHARQALDLWREGVMRAIHRGADQ